MVVFCLLKADHFKIIKIKIRLLTAHCREYDRVRFIALAQVRRLKQHLSELCCTAVYVLIDFLRFPAVDLH